MEENRIPKKVLYVDLEAKRLRGRPRNRRQDEVREDGRLVGGEGRKERVYNTGMEEAPENGKVSSDSARANVMNEWTLTKWYEDILYFGILSLYCEKELSPLCSKDLQFVQLQVDSHPTCSSLYGHNMCATHSPTGASSRTVILLTSPMK
jgi:hypothetical protein